MSSYAAATDSYESVGFGRRHDLGRIVFPPAAGAALALYE